MILIINFNKILIQLWFHYQWNALIIETNYFLIIQSLFITKIWKFTPTIKENKSKVMKIGGVDEGKVSVSHIEHGNLLNIQNSNYRSQARSLILASFRKAERLLEFFTI